MNFLLETTNSSLGETLAFGGEVVLVGMLVIFSVLGLLWACLAVFRIVFYDLPMKRSRTVVENDTASDEAVAPVLASGNDDEIIAVIAAAIAAAESESVGVKFRVVSFRRK